MTNSLVAHIYVIGICIWSKGFPSRSVYFLLISVCDKSLAVSYVNCRLSKWKEGRKEGESKESFKAIEPIIAFTLKTNSSSQSSIFLQLLSHRNWGKDVFEEKKGNDSLLFCFSEYILECTGDITQSHSPVSSTFFMNSALVATTTYYGTLMGYCAKTVQPCHASHHFGYQLYK